MKIKWQWRWIYVLFLCVFLMIVRAQSSIQQALENTRIGGLMPIGPLALKHLGNLIPIVPFGLGVLFLISWKVAAVNSAKAAAITSTILALALAAYTLLCLLVIAMHL